jgi:glycosyltransferase involved in cell wall biosynthesis
MKVKYLPWQPHCFAFGGLEIQMLSTFQAVLDAGVDAEKMDVWSRDNDFDILHVWGFDNVHQVAVYYAKKSEKKVVITSLFQDFNSVSRIIRHNLSRYVGPVRHMLKLAQMADSIVVVNEMEVDIATKYFNIPSSKITYIPNIVNQKYYDIVNTPSDFMGLSNYVLCTGNVCVRKNQLNLVKACKLNGVSLMILGNALLGEDEYCQQVQQLVNETENIIWIKGIKENDDQLLNAYKNCSLFALPSLQEQGPISAYEALACGCKVVIAERKYAYQGYYQNVERVDPFSVRDIARGILKVLNDGEKYIPAKGIMDPSKAKNVGLKYKEVYERLV